MSMIEFNHAEIKDRTEWLFWECYKQTDNKLDNLCFILQIDDSKWNKQVRFKIFYETLLWSFGQSIAVLRGFWNKRLTEEDIDGIVLDLILFLEIFFSQYKNYEIMTIFSNYVIASEFEKDPTKLRNEIESYYIQRVCHLLELDYNKLNQQETKDLIFSKFPWGWVLAADAFIELPINDVRASNHASRHRFKKELLEAKKRSDEGETAKETQERRRWEEFVDEFNKIVGDALEEVNDAMNRLPVTAPHSSKKRILVVDDEENVRMLYQEELQEEGYDVETASDGIEALEMLANKGPFDLVTTCIRMPRMDGIDLVREIKEKYRNTPVIIVTSYSEYKEDVSTWAADAYIVKSHDLAELKDRIKKMLSPEAITENNLPQNTSIEKALPIMSVSEEYLWSGYLLAHDKSLRFKMQKLMEKNGKAYDVLCFEKTTGEEVNLYFDISSFYGKGDVNL